MLKYFCASHLRIKHFELPLHACLQNSTYENKIDLDAHLKSNISGWLLLLPEYGI